jgi:hypothetical protein
MPLPAWHRSSPLKHSAMSENVAHISKRRRLAPHCEGGHNITPLTSRLVPGSPGGAAEAASGGRTPPVPSIVAPRRPGEAMECASEGQTPPVPSCVLLGHPLPVSTGMQAALIQLEAESHAVRQNQARLVQADKQTSKTYERHLKNYEKWWCQYQHGLSTDGSCNMAIPAFPVTPAKVVMFLEHETAREKVSHSPSFLLSPPCLMLMAFLSQAEAWQLRDHCWVVCGQVPHCTSDLGTGILAVPEPPPLYAHP